MSQAPTHRLDNSAKPRKGSMTRWGRAEEAAVYAPGIVWVTTPSHGGFWISPERLAKMPERLRALSVSRDCWFEEDCAWCAVPLAFPEDLAEVMDVDGARDFYRANKRYIYP